MWFPCSNVEKCFKIVLWTAHFQHICIAFESPVEGNPSTSIHSLTTFISESLNDHPSKEMKIWRCRKYWLTGRFSFIIIQIKMNKCYCTLASSCKTSPGFTWWSQSTRTHPLSLLCFGSTAGCWSDLGKEAAGRWDAAPRGPGEPLPEHVWGAWVPQEYVPGGKFPPPSQINFEWTVMSTQTSFILACHLVYCIISVSCVILQT